MELPKKYNHLEIEKKWNEYWKKNKIYKFNSKSNKKIYSVDTPPPTYSGKMHIGHASSYSQQDFFVRYQRMKQKNIFFPFGTDDNGLPTEKLVERMNNINSNKMDRHEFIKLCQKTIKENIQDFISYWREIGMSCDFETTYSTIDDHSIKTAQKSFIDLYKKGFLKRVNVPVIWDTKMQTTLAQAELEDVEKESTFNDVIFKIGRDKLIISTTRPELIPACVALFYNPDDKRYKKYKGKKAKVPLFDYEVPILEDKQVETDKGTGLMMVCTFGDKYDIEKWMKYKLDLRHVIMRDGKLNELAGKYKGLDVKSARREIIEDLDKNKLLVGQKKIKHFVNIAERSGAEIEFIKSNQWAISVLDYKKELIKQGRKIRWYPIHMRKRYESWINNLSWDWVISRQRHFGVPFPVWYDKRGNIIIPSENELPVDPRSGKVPKGYKKSELIPEIDVMDTWMTSSISPQIVLDWVNDNLNHYKDVDFEKMFSMSVRPQAHDIIRTWAFYTIVKSYYHHKKIPWKDIVISGHVVREDRKKMSKSKGKVIDPREIIQKYGADSLRFWCSDIKLGVDVPYNEEELKSGQKIVIKLFNASKFAFMFLENYKPKRVNLMDVDNGILSKFNYIIRECGDAFEEYEYSKSKYLIENFFWNEICDNYLEIAKNRLYNGEGNDKKSALYTLNYLIENTLKLFAPIMPFISEEIYSWRNKESIHLQKWPDYDKKLISKHSEEVWERFVKVLNKVRKYKTKNSKSLKTEIVLQITKEDYNLLENSIEDLKSVTCSNKIVIGDKFKIKWK